jgi:hypothetical protein
MQLVRVLRHLTATSFAWIGIGLDFSAIGLVFFAVMDGCSGGYAKRPRFQRVFP